jgi:hypothetical protein
MRPLRFHASSFAFQSPPPAFLTAPYIIFISSSGNNSLFFVPRRSFDVTV